MHRGRLRRGYRGGDLRRGECRSRIDWGEGSRIGTGDVRQGRRDSEGMLTWRAHPMTPA
jgi:hypothetical protein